MVNINIENLKNFINDKEIDYMIESANLLSKKTNLKTGVGNDFLGWVDLPSSIDKEELIRINNIANKIKKESDYLVVVGIGGSYLGAKAVLEALKNPFEMYSGVEVIFAGHTLSSTYMSQLLSFLEDKSFSINVISKSGTTTEPAIAFRLLKNLLVKQLGEENANKKIYATTDKSKGALKTIADFNNYETFVIPDDVGGRYSVLTPVGLLPIAAAGYDIEKLVKGAYDAEINYKNKQGRENETILYAIVRNILYSKGKTTEIMVSYEPYLQYLNEWYKQLFGESEGKDGKGIFPASAIFSTDLHSMGQYIQDGRRNIFETIINVNSPREDILLEKQEDNNDKLNYLDGKTLDYVNKMAQQGTVMAHVDGNVPNIIINIDKIDEYNMGYLMYFFEKSCAISGYLLGVNPFDQPGVEAYKKNMFKLLGKPEN